MTEIQFWLFVLSGVWSKPEMGLFDNRPLSMSICIRLNYFVNV